MRSVALPIIAVAALLLLVPPVTAHVTVTVVAPSGRLPIGTATEITATASANCAAGVADYQAMSRDIRFGLAPDAPAWLMATGETVPMTASQCGTDGNMKNSGKVKITPGPLAPGLQEVNLKIVAYAGTENHGEATVPITIAYLGAFNISEPQPEYELDNGSATVDLEFNATINADSMFMIEVLTPPEYGTLNIPTSLSVASALAENKTFRVVPFQVTYQADPDANFTMDMGSVRVLMHAASDPGSITQAQDFGLMFVPDADADHDHSTHDHGEDGGGVPGFDVAILVAGAVAAAALVRRR
jgi:hypothetical protein